MANPTPQYRYNERAGRFVDSRGRFVSQSRVTAALNDVIDAAAAEMRAASVGLQSGSVTLAQWQLIMEANIKNMRRCLSVILPYIGVEVNGSLTL